MNYFPVDISWAALAEGRERVSKEAPQTHVRPVVADFGDGFGFLRDISGRKLVLYLGSSIGNFDPDAAIDMLRSVRSELNDGDTLLLGTDLVKNPVHSGAGLRRRSECHSRVQQEYLAKNQS